MNKAEKAALKRMKKFVITHQLTGDWYHLTKMAERLEKLEEPEIEWNRDVGTLTVPVKITLLEWSQSLYSKPGKRIVKYFVQYPYKLFIYDHHTKVEARKAVSEQLKLGIRKVTKL